MNPQILNTVLLASVFSRREQWNDSADRFPSR